MVGTATGTPGGQTAHISTSVRTAVCTIVWAAVFAEGRGTIQTADGRASGQAAKWPGGLPDCRLAGRLNGRLEAHQEGRPWEHFGGGKGNSDG